MANEPSILGTGWSFPPVFTREEGGVEMRSDAEDVNESLEVLFSTRLGERYFAPDFGANLERLVFEPLDASLKAFMRTLLEEGIARYEPRIVVNEIQLETDDLQGLVRITVDYTIPGTNSSINFVYPLFLNEGINP